MEIDSSSGHGVMAETQGLPDLLDESATKGSVREHKEQKEQEEQRREDQEEQRHYLAPSLR